MLGRISPGQYRIPHLLNLRGGTRSPNNKKDFKTALTLADITSAVSDFVTDYGVYISAGLVLGLGGFVVTRLIKAGR